MLEFTPEEYTGACKVVKAVLDAIAKYDFALNVIQVEPPTGYDYNKLSEHICLAMDVRDFDQAWYVSEVTQKLQDKYDEHEFAYNLGRDIAKVMVETRRVVNVVGEGDSMILTDAIGNEYKLDIVKL